MLWFCCECDSSVAIGRLCSDLSLCSERNVLGEVRRNEAGGADPVERVADAGEDFLWAVVWRLAGWTAPRQPLLSVRAFPVALRPFLLLPTFQPQMNDSRVDVLNLCSNTIGSD